MEEIWHQKEINDVYKQLETDPRGLTTQEAAARLERYGPNELAETATVTFWSLLANQFKSFMVIVLVVAAVISGIVGDKTDTIVILVIVVLNAILGFLQEYRAEKAMSALKRISTSVSRVKRNGREDNIQTNDIVPGDIVILEPGVIVPADMRIVDARFLQIEESALTGESNAVDKISAVLNNDAAALGDRINMAYKGTKVINGRGIAVVTATGMRTELGKIAEMLKVAPGSTPLQRRMAAFGKRLSYIIIAICVALFGVGLLRGEEPVDMLLVALSLAVAAIPEALPALITIALAQGASRLAKKNALIRRLHAVETLGSVTYICTDKTGTLTQNKMKVNEVFTADHSQVVPGMPVLQTLMTLNQDVTTNDNGVLLGDPLEIAMVEYVGESGANVSEILSQHQRLYEIPFDADRKCMTTVHRLNSQFLVVVKGAIEAIVQRVSTDNVVPGIDGENHRMSSQGMRVLAYGYKVVDDVSQPIQSDQLESGLRFAGLVGLMDPPREEAAQAIAECKKAGINVVMITGDHVVTASTIAKKLGLLNDDDLQVTGVQLGQLSPESFTQQVEKIRLYARVSPAQKLMIVQGLQSTGHFVAMTGDGVNDAPSLKAADIGVAMGITGTDVSKESADMILLDDNFATIVKAIKEGRTIYDNIRKFVKYVLTCNGAEIWTIFMAPVLGLPIPLLPIHLLWINLVTDGLPGLALSYEKPEADIMNRPPTAKDESLFSRGVGAHVLWVGIFMAAVTLITQYWATESGNPAWQTITFTTLSLSQLAHVYAIRSEHKSIFQLSIFSNVRLIGALLITLVLQLIVIYHPVANRLLKTQPLQATDIAVCVTGALLIMVAVELEKAVKLFRKKKVLHKNARASAN